MPSKRHCCFYAIATLFSLTSHWLSHATAEGIEPANRESYTPERGEASRYASAPDDAGASQRPKIYLTPDLINPINPNHDVANTEITGSKFNNVHQKRRDLNRLFYNQRSAQVKQLDRGEIRDQDISLIKRPAQNQLTAFLENPTIMYNTTNQKILANLRKKEPGVARTNNTLNTQRLNLTVNVAKLDLCVLLCLAHGSCLGAIFDARKSVCKLKDKLGDPTNQQAPPNGVEIHSYNNNDVKYFTVNHKRLTNIIGKCSDQPCKNGTFCSHLNPASYACLPLAQFIHRIRNRELRPQEEEEVKEERKEAAETETKQGERLVRKKRDLNEVKPDVKDKSSTHKGPVDCGLPPTFPKVLSLFTKTTIGATATYYCENGVHTEKASTVIICQSNGQWSKSKFKCIHTVPCATPKEIPGTVMHISGHNGTKVAKYVCKNNPYLSNLTICNRRDGSWSPLKMNCNSHTDGAKHLSLDNKLDHSPNLKPPGTKQSHAGYPTHDSRTHIKKNKVKASDHQRRTALKSKPRRSDVPDQLSNETSDGNKATDQDLDKKEGFNTSTVPLLNATLDVNKATDQDLDPKEGFNTSTVPLSNKTSYVNNATNQNLSQGEGSYTSLSNATSDVNNATNRSLNQGNPFNNSIVTSSNATSDVNNATNLYLDQDMRFNTSTVPLSNGTSDVKNATNPYLDQGNVFNTSTVPLSNATSDVKNATNPYLDQGNAFNTSTVPLSNATSDVKNATNPYLDQDKRFNTSTVPLSNGTSDVKNATTLYLDQDMRFNTSTVPLSNGTLNNNKTMDHDLGQGEDLYSTIAPESNMTSDNYATTQAPHDDDSVKVTFWEMPIPEKEKVLPPLGIMRGNINSMMGMRGFFCWYPGPVTFAVGFYNSRIVGSKIVYRCSRYFFSTPAPHCPIVTCLTYGLWSDLSMSCSDLDCVNPQNQYIGKRTCSRLGFSCRNWADVIRDPYQLSTVTFPDGNITMAKNYCRDPLPSGFLWCFTNTPSVVWDFCDVPTCP